MHDGPEVISPAFVPPLLVVFQGNERICGCIMESALTWLITMRESKRATRPSATKVNKIMKTIYCKYCGKAFETDGSFKRAG